MTQSHGAGLHAGFRPPVETVNLAGRSPVILLCEHASAYIPAQYGRLGMSEAEAQSHISWDIGAEQVTRHLARILDAPAFLATHSRLMIDLNRPPDVASSIAARSEATDITGNLDLPEAERTARLRGLFEPYHDAVAEYIDQRTARDTAPLRILSVHSFTRIYLGETRPWDIGVLYDRAKAWGEHLLASLSAAGDLCVGANVPYSIGPEWDYAVPVHGDARGIDAMLIEICNDLIADDDGSLAIAERLAPLV